MIDLISRNALIKIIVEWPERLGIIDPSAGILIAERLGCLEALEAIRNEVERQPTIDAVTVVRCKDCWKRGGYHCPMFFEEQTYNEDDGYDWIERDHTSDDGFCNDGARLDGDADG